MVVFVVLDVLLAWIGSFFEKRKQEEYLKKHENR